MGLITFADCQIFDQTLNIADQPTWNVLIAGATAFVERYCNRKFDVVELTDYDTLRNPLVLREHPVSACQVYIDATGVFGAGTEVTNFYLNKQTGTIRFFADIVMDLPVKIVYTPSGFATVPDDLREAIYKLVRWNKSRLEAETVGVKSILNNGINTTFTDTIPWEVRQVLNQYRV